MEGYVDSSTVSGGGGIPAVEKESLLRGTTTGTDSAATDAAAEAPKLAAVPDNRRLLLAILYSRSRIENGHFNGHNTYSKNNLYNLLSYFNGLHGPNPH